MAGILMATITQRRYIHPGKGGKEGELEAWALSSVGEQLPNKHSVLHLVLCSKNKQKKTEGHLWLPCELIQLSQKAEVLKFLGD